MPGTDGLVDCCAFDFVCSRSAARPAEVVHVPVVEVGPLEELASYFPSGVPVVHLIQSPALPPLNEAAHLPEEGAHPLPEGMTLEVRAACTARLDRGRHPHDNHTHAPPLTRQLSPSHRRGVWCKVGFAVWRRR